MNPDEEHLRILSVLHYLAATMTLLLALLPLGYALLAVSMVFHGDRVIPGASPQALDAVKWLSLVVGIGGFLIGLSAAIANFSVGRFLSQRSHRRFCLVIAACNCLQVPLGTLLGVFTLVVLSRPSVQTLFDDAPPPETIRPRFSQPGSPPP